MALLNSFNYLVRTANLGKFTQEPLLVRFTTDGVGRRRTGESTAYCLAERYVEKHYRWSGYTLNMAKQIANFYSAGNGTRAGYYRRFREYSFDAVAGWTYRTYYSTKSVVKVEKVGGDMYAVDIVVDEVDQFLVDADNIPSSFDGWCGAFHLFYLGDEWAAFNGGSATPYTYEKFYDEPLTVKEV